MATRGAVVQVRGLRELRRDLRKIGDDLRDLKAVNAAVAALVAVAGTSRAPRRTGRLAGSVRGNRAAGRATVSAGGASVPYAGPIHWGWPARGIEAQPFLSDAALATESAWLPLYEAGIEKALDRVAGNTY